MSWKIWQPISSERAYLGGISSPDACFVLLCFACWQETHTNSNISLYKHIFKVVVPNVWDFPALCRVLEQGLPKIYFLYRKLGEEYTNFLKWKMGDKVYHWVTDISSGLKDFLKK